MSPEQKTNEQRKWGSKRSHPSHDDWNFRKEAVIWLEGRPYRPNLRSYAFELRSWMMRDGTINYLFQTDSKYRDAPSNPYTYNASNLAMSYSAIINDSHAFGSGNGQLNSVDAEIKYLRLRSELVLYTARLCEVLIKQLLFCTDFSPEQYDKAALGGLMSARCIGCQKTGKKHFLSLLGSLAHRYGLCHSLDNCLHGKMEIANVERNTTAAHSGAAAFIGRPVRNSRRQMLKVLDDIGNEFIHMLNHIADFESRITTELETLIRHESRAIIKVGFPVVGIE